MNSHIPLSKRLLVLFVVTMFIFGGMWTWWRDGILATDPSDVSPQMFVVHRGEGVKSVASRLAQQNLIRSPISFYILVRFLQIGKDIQAGDYRLNKAMDARTIAMELTHGIIDVWVTTLEGWRAEEIAIELAKDLDIPEQEFLKHAKEGYMFPDTYLIPQDATPAAIADIFYSTFESKITKQVREDAQKAGLTFDDVITLASIVEREGLTGEDRPVIAGILLKRLRSGWPLQADATVQYALGYQAYEKSWWKKVLTHEDLKVQSPYNTYINTGLPPHPISSPGFSSIQAVVYPAHTEYWYYLHDLEGNVYYAKTIEEHNTNISRYLK